MPFAFLVAALAEVADPRRAQGQRYSMSHLLLFSVFAVLTGATSYKKIIAFIALQREHLNTVFGACFRRAPAVKTLRHLFLALSRYALEAAFRSHARDLSAGDTASMPRSVALDDRTLRGSFDHLTHPQGGSRAQCVNKRVTRDGVEAALRSSGVGHASGNSAVILKTDGSVSIIKVQAAVS